MLERSFRAAFLGSWCALVVGQPIECVVAQAALPDYAESLKRNNPARVLGEEPSAAPPLPARPTASDKGNAATKGAEALEERSRFPSPYRREPYRIREQRPDTLKTR